MQSVTAFARRLFASFACFALLALPAQAAVLVAPDVTGTVDVVGMMSKNFNFPGMSSNVALNPDGKSYTFMGNDATPVWDFNWMLVANADPFIDSIFTFTNLTGVTQTFNVGLNLPVAPPFSPGLKSGDLAFNFSDANSSGSAGVSNISWTGLIDASPAMSIFAADAICGGAGCSFAVGPILNGPLLHPTGVASTLGILLSFDLTAGDTVTFDTRFEVVPVPVPAAAWLFGSALGLLMWTRRRQSPRTTA